MNEAYFKVSLKKVKLDPMKNDQEDLALVSQSHCNTIFKFIILLSTWLMGKERRLKGKETQI